MGTCVVLLAAVVTVSAQANTAALSLRVASGGGGVATQAQYALTASIGQHDAGAQASGSYLMVGGVLAASGGSAATPTPTLTPPGTPAATNYLPLVTK